MLFFRKNAIYLALVLLLGVWSTVFWSGGALSGKNLISHIKKRGLWHENVPLRLHLGCGESLMKGYVNIGLPSANLKAKPDYTADILKLDFPEASVDEILLQRGFEHFDRVTALAQLTKWHKWLKVGGILHIETPDAVGCAKILVSDASYKVKMGIIRHFAGDQAASFGDHWFPERYEHTLSKLGFAIVSIENSTRDSDLFLANVTVIAKKTKDLSNSELIAAGRELLWESTADPSEKISYEKWEQQFLHAVTKNAKKSARQGHDFAPVAENQALK